MNVHENRSKESTRWTFTLRINTVGYIFPFKFITGNRDALKLQLSAQTSNFVQDGSKM